MSPQRDLPAPTILVTGFEPFGGETLNPSWLIASQLDGAHIKEAVVCARQLPCAFGECLTVLDRLLTELKPQLVLALGQAGGRVDLQLERVAINVDDARIADNLGHQPVDQPVVADGPAAYFSTLPIKAIVARLRSEGIPASVSQTAGTFVCNHLFYGLQHQLHGRGVRSGFMHVPFLPEQAADHPGQASMALDSMVRGVRLSLETAWTTVGDLRLAGGSIC